MESVLAITEIPEDEVCYIRFDPPISDFTKTYSGRLVILTQNRSMSCHTTDFDFKYRLRTFYHTIWQSILSDGRTCLVWDIKKFISYLRRHLKGPVSQPKANIVDLKYGSSFVGNRTERPPQTFSDALKLSKSFIENQHWAKVNRLVYLPLAFKVLPQLETTGIIDDNQRKVLYSSYEIEGQLNGRLIANKPADNFLTVHSIPPDQKPALRPLSDRRMVFIVMDYQHMEANFLQWLSKDKELQSALDRRDFYASLVPFNCPEESKHKIGKLIFLPLIYGMNAAGLSKKLKVSYEIADKLVKSITKRFSASFDWLSSQEEILTREPKLVDVLGRCRDFTGLPSYKCRNFVVQSPAAILCLERLCALQSVLKSGIILHIHDGYVLASEPKECVDVVKKAHKILTSESPLCPGLRLKVSCQVGSDLANLKVINVEG